MVLTMLAAMALAAPGGWSAVPLVTAEQRQAGFAGGEGGQWPRSLEFAPSDPRFALFGTDVGGIFRSFDAGRSWSPCNVGYRPRGCADFAVDPGNARRVLAVGMNSGPAAHHGLYLSEDQAASWRAVLLANLGGNDDIRDQLAFDASTWDPKARLTRRVYWSRIARDAEAWGNRPDVKPALYRSDDGGRTWKELAGSARFGGSMLKVAGGKLFAANEEGLFRSADGGGSFVRCFEGEVTGLDVVPSRPRSVWMTTGNQVWFSGDAGDGWRRAGPMPEEGDGPFRWLKVSPADPDRLAIWRQGENWNWPRFVSHDGGKIWVRSTKDDKGAFLPDNSRQGLFAWHPRDANVVLSIGGDWPTRSADGGKTFAFSGQGDNGVLVGGRFAFSANAPDTVFFGSQDYNGAITHDAGRTWTYTNISGLGWGGYCYGGYAVTRDFLVAGNSDGWTGKRILRVSQDGGRTWTDTGIVLAGPDASYGVPGNPQVAFAFDHRTEDGGRTWSRMDGCQGVFAHFDQRLFGAHGRSLVASDDEGRTWTVLAGADAEIADVAAGPAQVFVVAGERLWRFEGGTLEEVATPRDAGFGPCVRSVAVDPADPQVVYVGSAGNYYSTDFAVLRSTDGGRTWTNLTRRTALGRGDVDGGREALCVRVHPKTRQLLVSTSCYGIWRWTPPK